jgi:hypothetical protein
MGSDHYKLDTLVRERLTQWPQRPPGLANTPGRTDGWLKGRPAPATGKIHPFLKLPGSDLYRTLPDGLWLNFGGTPAEPFVDIFAVEACSTLTNLLDKRSRFAPSTHSMLAVCPVAWLLGPVSEQDKTPRWRATGVLRQEPTQALSLVVRDMRVLYGLKNRHFEGFTRHQVPHPHEYFVPMDALTAQNSHENPAMRALVARAAVNGNFMDVPPPPPREPPPAPSRRSAPAWMPRRP